MKKYVIIVAGGKGLRMGGDIPKQFLPVDGSPILMRTLSQFHQYDPQMGIILVLPESQISYWKNLCVEYDFKIPYQLALGGETRFHSVKNGLALVPNDPEVCVGVHDGVRPFVSHQVIEEAYKAAAMNGAAVPAIPLVDSIRKVDLKGGNEAKNRAEYRLVQTPQVFRADLLWKAYEQDYCEEFTDDASVVERLGHKMTLTDGNRENIKITTSFDLILAEAFLRKNDC